MSKICQYNAVKYQQNRPKKLEFQFIKNLKLKNFMTLKVMPNPGLNRKVKELTPSMKYKHEIILSKMNSLLRQYPFIMMLLIWKTEILCLNMKLMLKGINQVILKCQRMIHLMSICAHKNQANNYLEVNSNQCELFCLTKF